MGTVQVSDFRFGEGTVMTLQTWQLDNDDLGELVSEKRKWQTLKLKIRTQDPTVARRMKDRAGELEVIPKSDGSYKAVDRAGGLNTFDLFPPSGREDVRTSQKYLAQNYNESVIDQQGNTYEVTLSLMAEDPKTKAEDYGTTAKGNNEWKFSFDAGEIATTRVKHNVARLGEKGVEGLQLNMGLEASETIIVEESLRRLNGVTVRDVPDGENIAEDDSTGQVCTVNVQIPDRATGDVESGDYVVSEYNTNWLNEAFYRVKLKMVKK